MSDSESEGSYDSDEVKEAYQEAKAGLQDGTLSCLNSNGTYRCPFSPGRKKQHYTYNEIKQHAEGVSKGKRGPVPVGKHSALVAYLDSGAMAAKAQPRAQRTLHLLQQVPPRIDSEDKRVHPWMGILCNIDTETQRSNDGKEFLVGAGSAEIKEKLKVFNPESVKVLYDYKGHQGVAVIGFRNSIDGFKDAEAFENSFYYKRKGRKDFENDFPIKCGTHLYAWMATKKDFEGGNKSLTDYLKSSGDLKSLPDIVKELEDMAHQQVQKLKKVVIKNEGALQATAQENWGLTNKVDQVTAQREEAEQEKQKLIQDHKKELEDLQEAALFAAQIHDENMRNHRLQIENRLRELETKSFELEKLKLENEAEKAQNYAEKRETERLLAWYQGQVKQQEAQQIKQIGLIKKHQAESENLENELQVQRKKLQVKQRRELESQRVTEQLETEKAKKAEISSAKKQETEKEKEEYVKKISELEEKLKDLEEDADDANEMVKTLTTSQRQVNDEVQDAKNTILKSKMLDTYGTSEIGVKRLGELNTEGWYEVCKDKFETPDAFLEWVSVIDNRLNQHDFNPLKTVPDGKGGKRKYAVDEDDETLTELRNSYGPVVANAVGTAALEIETWNPSGRYITPMPWDFTADTRATMSQIFQLFVKVIKDKEQEVKDKEQEVKEKDKELKKFLNTPMTAPKKTPAPAPKRKRT